MRTQPIPLVGGSYADETRPWSQQDTVNYLPCLAEVAGTRSEAMLKTPPGLKPFVEIADAPPVRRTHNAEGKLFAVIGPTLYQISNAGIAIPRGTVPGIGRVVMAHNQISLGNEVLAVNGQAGYVYNTVTDTFERITDPGYPGSATAVFIDGYLVQIEPQGRYAFNSDVANATQYNTLDRFTSEVSPDRLVAPAVFNNKLLLLSRTTSEWFENTGASQQPFRSTRITMDKGCAGPYTVAHADNTVFFLGSDGMFYMVEGYRPVRISRRPLEQAIRGLNWNQAFAEVWEDAGFTVIYWTFPDGRTWGYNTADKEWHRRESYGLGRWRVNTMTRWNEVCIAGDFQTGRLWELDWNYILEGDQEFISERTLAVIHDNQNLVLIPRVEVVMDTGQEETVPIPFPVQPGGPTLTGSAPDGALDSVYLGFTYTATPGDSPISSVKLISGSIPTPLMSTTQGAIETGTTTVIGEFTGTWRAKDENGLWADHTDTIRINSVFYIAHNESGGDVFVGPGGEGWSNENLSDPGIADYISLMGSGDGKLFAFSNEGGFGRMSYDFGQSWASITGLQTTNPPAAMVRTNDRFIVAYTPTIGGVRVSEEGLVFTNSAIPVDRTVVSMATDGDIVVMTTTSGVFIRSTDGGLSWDEYFDAALVGIFEITHGLGLFVIVGDAPNTIYTSPTGADGSWTHRTSPSAHGCSFRGLQFGNGAFVWISGNSDVVRSINGTTWILGQHIFHEPGGIPHYLMFAPNAFVAVADEFSLWRCVDAGITWTSMDRPTGMSDIRGLTGLIP